MNEEQVVKCGSEQCGMYFGYTPESPKCPFCRTEHGKATKEVEEKKEVKKPRKESFKMWKDN